MRLRIANCGSRIADCWLWTVVCKFAFRNVASAFRIPHSAFRNPALLIVAALMFACANGANSSKPETQQTPVAQGDKADKSADKSKSATAFDGERAFNHVKAQVEFGPRPAG